MSYNFNDIFDSFIGMVGCLIGPFSISANLVIISRGNVSSNDRARHSEDCRYEVYLSISYHAKKNCFSIFIFFSRIFLTMLTLRKTDLIYFYNSDFHSNVI